MNREKWSVILDCIVILFVGFGIYLGLNHWINARPEFPYASPTNLEVMRSKAVPVTTYIVQIKHGEYWYNLYRIPVESDHPLVIQDSAATEFPNVRVRHD